MRLADIKNIKIDTDVVSALVHACKFCYQLDPHFEWKENKNGQSRFKFTASVLFHGLQISRASGQNKAESKKQAAKAVLYKVMPNLYEDLFGDESPPTDEFLPAQKMAL